MPTTAYQYVYFKRRIVSDHLFLTCPQNADEPAYNLCACKEEVAESDCLPSSMQGVERSDTETLQGKAQWEGNAGALPVF